MCAQAATKAQTRLEDQDHPQDLHRLPVAASAWLLRHDRDSPDCPYASERFF
jgi:hypothetical protein